MGRVCGPDSRIQNDPHRSDCTKADALQVPIRDRDRVFPQTLARPIAQKLVSQIGLVRSKVKAAKLCSHL